MTKKIIFLSAVVIIWGILVSVRMVFFDTNKSFISTAFAANAAEHESDQGEEHKDYEHQEEKVHSDEEKHDEGNAHSDENIHEEDSIRFSTSTLEEFEIKTAKAAPGTLTTHIEVSGEVGLNPDTIAHIVPRVPGVVKEIYKSLGDTVQKDELLAVLESRELATLKTKYLAALERYKLTQTIFEREEELWKKKISAEQDYLTAKQALAEARINVNSAEQQLHAVGFAEDSIKQFPTQVDDLLTHYEIRSPLGGQITEKHLTLGEFVKDDTSVFTIADLQQVWVNLTLYQNNLSSVRIGQTAVISFNLGDYQTTGIISYISPILDEHSRTASARVVIDNTTGALRPGSFVSGSIVVDQVPVSVYLPKTAIQTIENKPAVFVQHDDYFEPQFVRLGRTNEVGAEIVTGLTPGQVYVSEGGFALKAEMEKEAFAEGGHAH